MLPSVFTNRLYYTCGVPNITFLRVGHRTKELNILVTQVVPNFFCQSQVKRKNHFTSSRTTINAGATAAIQDLVTYGSGQSRYEGQRAIQGGKFRHRSLFLVLCPYRALNMLGHVMSNSLSKYATVSDKDMRRTITRPLSRFAV